MLGLKKPVGILTTGAGAVSWEAIGGGEKMMEAAEVAEDVDAFIDVSVVANGREGSGSSRIDVEVVVEEVEQDDGGDSGDDACNEEKTGVSVASGGSLTG